MAVRFPTSLPTPLITLKGTSAAAAGLSDLTRSSTAFNSPIYSSNNYRFQVEIVLLKGCFFYTDYFDLYL